MYFLHDNDITKHESQGKAGSLSISLCRW
ncbi:hypothetical protein MNBD_DELTA03-1491, partial [hydrothermal vent metagenome]